MPDVSSLGEASLFERSRDRTRTISSAARGGSLPDVGKRFLIVSCVKVRRLSSPIFVGKKEVQSSGVGMDHDGTA
jgi:hypothetical protein